MYRMLLLMYALNLHCHRSVASFVCKYCVNPLYTQFVSIVRRNALANACINLHQHMVVASFVW